MDSPLRLKRQDALDRGSNVDFKNSSVTLSGRPLFFVHPSLTTFGLGRPHPSAELLPQGVGRDCLLRERVSRHKSRGSSKLFHVRVVVVAVVVADEAHEDLAELLKMPLRA